MRVVPVLSSILVLVAGCFGPAGDGPGSETEDPSPPRPFSINFTESRNLWDSFWLGPSGGGTGSGASGEIVYWGNATATNVTLVLDWAPESALSQTLQFRVERLEDQRLQIVAAIEGPPPLELTFQPVGANESWSVRPSGPAGLSHRVSVTVTGTITYEERPQ